MPHIRGGAGCAVRAAHLVLEDVHQAAQLVQALQLDEDGPERIVQDGAQGVHQRGQRTALAVRVWEKVVKQLVLHLAHLDSGKPRNHVSDEDDALMLCKATPMVQELPGYSKLMAHDQARGT